MAFSKYNNMTLGNKGTIMIFKISYNIQYIPKTVMVPTVIVLKILD